MDPLDRKFAVRASQPVGAHGRVTQLIPRLRTVMIANVYGQWTNSGELGCG
jgi:hypothetical protein